MTKSSCFFLILKNCDWDVVVDVVVAVFAALEFAILVNVSGPLIFAGRSTRKVLCSVTRLFGQFKRPINFKRCPVWDDTRKKHYVRQNKRLTIWTISHKLVTLALDEDCKIQPTWLMIRGSTRVSVTTF